jgi:hypothetical protein
MEREAKAALPQACCISLPHDFVLYMVDGKIELWVCIKPV